MTDALAAGLGLTVAFGGTALLVSPAARVLGAPDRLATKLLELAVLWALFAGVLAVVLVAEGKPLASLWLRPLHWSSFAWGLGYAAVVVRVVTPAREWARRAAGLGGYEAGMAKLVLQPGWYRALASVTAGVTEETLFHGYALTRLAFLTGSTWLGAGLTAAVFGAVHVPFWGAGPSFAFFLGGLASAAFFVWRQDLLAMIVAHAAVDLFGLVIAPRTSAWWKSRRFGSPA
jgi:membrane protease YdiL (CAAX protease family)